MVTGHWWRWAKKATIGVLAMIGLYYLAHLEPMKGYLDQIANYFNSPGRKSSITRAQLKRGIDFSPEKGPYKITPKAPGLWRVSHNNEDWSDGDDLASVIYSAGDMDVIEISPGTYNIKKLTIDRPMLLKGTGSKAQDVIIEVSSKSTINLFNAKIRKVEFQGLTLKSVELKLFEDAFLDVQDSEVGLYKTSFQSSGHQYFARLSRASKILGRECEFFSGDQFDTLFLEGKSQLDLDNCHFKSHKIAVSTHITNFEGTISITNSEIGNSRSHALMVYGGTVKLETVAIHGGQGGIYLGNKTNASLTSVTLDGLQVNGIEMADGATMKLEDVSIAAKQTAILALNTGTAIQGAQLTLLGSQRGLYLREGATATLSKVNVSGASISGIILERQSSLVLDESTIEPSGSNCVEAQDSRATLRSVTLANCLFAFNLNQNSQIKYKQLTFKNNKEKVHNNFNSSKFEELH